MTHQNAILILGILLGAMLGAPLGFLTASLFIIGDRDEQDKRYMAGDNQQTKLR